MLERFTHWRHLLRLSLFEKVILINSGLLLGEALIGLWITSHELESHHYLIDTLFIVVATLCTISINILVLRINFQPFFNLLGVIREVSMGKTQARAQVPQSSWEIKELAEAFNAMLDRLANAQREQTLFILQAQEDERRRISLELHDEAGQNLTALLIHVEMLNRHFRQRHVSPLTAEDQQLLDEIGQLTTLTGMTLENVRVLAQQLRPSVLDDLGLLAAFRWLVEDSYQRLHLHVELDIQEPSSSFTSLPSSHEIALFRVAQESLTNVARHAQTDTVHLALQHKHHAIHLTIQDKGIGFTHDWSQAGTGMTGMRERIRALDGTFTITSHSGQGTTVEAVVPEESNAR
jgi:two-component system, NarL family, sensor histidine kinase UhpB